MIRRNPKKRRIPKTFVANSLCANPGSEKKKYLTSKRKIKAAKRPIERMVLLLICLPCNVAKEAIAPEFAWNIFSRRLKSILLKRKKITYVKRMQKKAS